MFPTWKDNKPFSLALLVLCSFLTVFVWAKTDKTVRETREIGKPVPYEHSITVDAQAKVTGVPNIATINYGVETKSPTLAEAQKKNTDVANALLAKVGAAGIAKEDIQTSSYNSYQETVWNPSKQTSDPGNWIVSQQMTVKVRDITKVSSLLETLGQNGATNVYGPNFAMDEQENLKSEAREKALAQIEKKAADLAEKLGVRLERVIGYSEYTNDGAYPMYAYAREGMGGGGPAVSPGSVDLTLNVTVTYKLVE